MSLLQGASKKGQAFAKMCSGSFLKSGPLSADYVLCSFVQRGPRKVIQVMSEPTVEATMAGRHRAGKYLTFTLHQESYGIDVLKIREIIRLTNITAVPRMPAYVRGVINLRGKIIPIMDLRLRFGFPDAQSTEQTCIIVVQVKLADGKCMQMGLVVDAVEEVANLAAADIEETPNFGGEIATDYITGMAKIKGAVKTLLDIDKIVDAESVESMRISKPSVPN
jgi:purine-binding chemotaxis protein CheW